MRRYSKACKLRLPHAEACDLSECTACGGQGSLGCGGSRHGECCCVGGCCFGGSVPQTLTSVLTSYPVPVPLQSTLVEAEGGLAALLALGWQQGEESGEAVVTLPKGGASMAQVGWPGCGSWGVCAEEASRVWLVEAPM